MTCKHSAGVKFCQTCAEERIAELEGELRCIRDHIASCPIGWHGDKLIHHRSTTEADVLEWLQKLQERWR